MRPQSKDDALVKVLNYASIAVMVVCLVSFFFPKPTTKGLQKKFNADRLQSVKDTVKAEKREVESRTWVKPQVWSGTPANVVPAAFDRANSIAQAHGVHIVSFRPQRVNEAGELLQLPFVMNVEGTFPSVASFEAELEKPTTKLAVNVVQITANDSANEQVTGTIGVVAYMAPTLEESEATEEKEEKQAVKADSAKPSKADAKSPLAQPAKKVDQGVKNGKA